MKTPKIFSSLMALALAACLLFTLGSAALASDEAAAASDEAAIEGLLDTSEFFTDRDLEQTADLEDATAYSLSDGEDIHIVKDGVFVLSGSASDVTVYVEASDSDKVQIVLDGAEITNKDFPCIYVRNADKVFVTTSADSALTVTDEFQKDGESKVNGVIFSRADLTLNGTAKLTIDSSKNGVICKDDLKVTGGSYEINTASQCLEVKDSLRVADGEFVLTAGTDGIDAENEDDETLGYIYIAGGSFTINAEDDGIHATSVLQIDGGSFDISSAEGIESTYIQLNGGTIEISCTDDGVNAAEKSAAYNPTIEINGGSVTVIANSKGDCFGSKGDIIINGGSVDVTGNNLFNFDGEGVINGGSVTANGEQISVLSK